ncbi:MAG: LapA family protein [Firmicutes bacterium]|nr:LapA family protein [Bacillota bacterium]
MQFLFVLALLFALAVAVFAVQNAEPITVNLIRWQLETSLVVVVLGSAATGAMVAGLVGLVRQLRASWRIRQLQSQVHRLEERLRALTESAGPPSKGEAPHRDGPPASTD